MHLCCRGLQQLRGVMVSIGYGAAASWVTTTTCRERVSRGRDVTRHTSQPTLLVKRHSGQDVHLSSAAGDEFEMESTEGGEQGKGEGAGGRSLYCRCCTWIGKGSWQWEEEEQVVVVMVMAAAVVVNG